MINLILPIILSLALFHHGVLNEKILNQKTGDEQEKQIGMPKLRVNNTSFTELESLYFEHSVGGKAIQEATKVAFIYDDSFLEINFECRDNPRVDQNFYTENNSPLFNQEVFEIFISPGEKASEHYWEIQLNPNNALFVAKVHNKYKTDQSFELEMIDNELAKIEHQVTKDPKNNSWKGHLKIPLQLIQGSADKPNKVFRMNLFRIISKEDHTDPEWQNNAQNATFACWNSSMADRPNFHKPDYFGFLYLTN
jgi:hypothetical protein